ALEALGDAGDHVGDQRAHGSRHRVGVVRVAQRLEDDLLAVFLHFHVGIGRARDRAERALDGDLAGGDVQLYALRHRNGIFCDSGNKKSEATRQSTSPPTPSARALRSVITPREVERIATPSPFITRGMSSRPLYTRSPGFDTRSSRSITGLPA